LGKKETQETGRRNMITSPPKKKKTVKKTPTGLLNYQKTNDVLYIKFGRSMFK